MANGLGGFTQPRKRIVGKPEWAISTFVRTVESDITTWVPPARSVRICRTEAADEPQAKPRRGPKGKGSRSAGSTAEASPSTAQEKRPRDKP